MYQQNLKASIAKTRRYNVSGSRIKSNYLWGTLSLVGGFGFFITGLYSYYQNFLVQLESQLQNSSVLRSFSDFQETSFFNANSWLFSFLNNFFSILGLNRLETESVKIVFFPQGLSMCFYGLVGIFIGTFLCFCIFFGIGCGFTEFNKETDTVRICRLGFPGKNRVLDYIYSLNTIQCICVKMPSSVVPTSQRGIYMRIKQVNNKTSDIPLDLYSEKTSLETIELQAADLSKFLRVSLSIGL